MRDLSWLSIPVAENIINYPCRPVLTRRDIQKIDAWFRKRNGEDYFNDASVVNCLLSNHLVTQECKVKRNKYWLLGILSDIETMQYLRRFDYPILFARKGPGRSRRVNKAGNGRYKICTR